MFLSHAPMILVAIAFLVMGAVLVALLIQEIRRQRVSDRRLRSGKNLQRRLAQSRRQFIGKPESWHWQRVTGQSKHRR